MTAENPQIERLSSLDTQQFREVVDDDIRSRIGNEPIRSVSPQQRELWELRAGALRDPVNVQRWLDTLVEMKTSVEQQLRAKKTSAPTSGQRLVDYERWKRNATRFKAGLDARLLEARELVRRMETASTNELAGRVDELETAIVTHRTNVEADSVPSTHDKELWSHVNT